MRDYSEQVLQQAPWSISKVGVLQLCMKQYEHKYINKDKEGIKSGASRVGVVAHAILEAGLNTPNTDLTAVLREQAEKETLTREDMLEVSAKLSPISDFIQRVRDFKAKNGVVEEFIEYKLAINANHEPCSFFETKNDAGEVTAKPLLRGVIDHAMRTSDDFLIVLDHKSGKKKPIAEHSTQFYSYMALAVAAFPWARGVQSGIHYIGEPRVDWFPRYDSQPGAWTREEVGRIVFPWLRHYLNHTTMKLSQIRLAREAPGTIQLAETGWQCVYCGYSAGCEKGQTELAKRAQRKQPQSNV